MTTNEQNWLAERFEEHRPRLRAVAYRMLGEPGEAEDAVQEAWLRLSRSDAGEVSNLGGWLTTVVARVCLNILRSRRTRSEEPLDDSLGAEGEPVDPEQEALMAESVGLALLVVLEMLAPSERVAFVLHDMFDLPFDDIAPIVGRTPDAARQLASRARRRVHGSNGVPGTDLGGQRAIVDAFLAASREGRFDALILMLDPEVVLRADSVAAGMGAPSRLRGARAVAETFSGRAKVARLALLGGAVGAVWAQGGVPRVAFSFTIEDGKIVAVDMIADPEHLGRLDVAVIGE